MAVACVVAVSTALGLAGPVGAQTELLIDDPNFKPIPIAIPQFAGGGQLASGIPGVVAADLQNSGLFEVVNPASYIQSPDALQAGPRFEDWAVINAQALVSGNAIGQADGRTRVEFRLWDVYAQTQLTGYAYVTTNDNWRRIGHLIADQIYKALTGEEGYFDTRIVYIAESGPSTRRVKRLAIMDQDGENNRYLTNGNDLVLTPRFSPNSQEITYMSYFNNRPRVYLFDIGTGRQEVLGDFPGMTYAPRFSPDGSKVIMSMAQDGDSSLYVMDLSTRRVSRLTNTPGVIDTSPSYSPDGSQIVFNSDRGGSQQLYVMGAGGGGATRISFGSGRYATPVWSPRGDLIAFTRMGGGGFQIGVMKPDGSGERILSQGTGAVQEGPTWAPNGRVLMFYRGSKLVSIDISGRIPEWVRSKPAGGASDPAWSPLLQ
ncbi:Tol-Pal system beta propeller repeat protein TolB [Zavarzinia sp. CC-PAN008]|uniref:Tol-Pal system beta propeller repeat protein TolB n=1 Tax=Zavarzinia sp. CC-PAN008 TaxID=3243332 RepID=UPI003F749D42